MGFFKKPKQTGISEQTDALNEEKNETTAKKQRLLETQGENKGAQLSASQGQSVRRIFG